MIAWKTEVVGLIALTQQEISPGSHTTHAVQ